MIYKKQKEELNNINIRVKWIIKNMHQNIINLVKYDFINKLEKLKEIKELEIFL